MKDTQLYSRDEVFQLMENLFVAIKARTGEMDVPDLFIAEHPWTRKYLSHFSEADTLLVECKSKGAHIIEAPWSEKLEMIRNERGLKSQLRFRIATPELSESRFIFSFEDRGDGMFIPLNS